VNITGATCPACGFQHCRRTGVSNGTIALVLLAGCLAWLLLLAGARAVLGRIHGLFVSAVVGAVTVWPLIHLQRDTQSCPSCGSTFGRHGY